MNNAVWHRSRLVPLALIGCTLVPLLGVGISAKALGRETQVRELVVDQPYPAMVGQIMDVRELSDGRLIIADNTERAVFVVSANGQRRTQLGRQGEGPGEYRSPARLFHLGGDSTLVDDLQTRNWLVLAGTQFVSLPAALQEIRLRAGVRLDGVSTAGALLQVIGRSETIRGGFVTWDKRRPARHDSIALVLHRAREKPDTVLRVSGHYLGSTSRWLRVNGETLMHNGLLNPLQTHDQALLFADGSIAVAYFGNYRVDWRRPDGTWIRGPSVGYVAPALTSTLRKRFTADAKRNDDGTPVLTEADLPPWPRTVPPFGLKALHSGPDGRLYVSRIVTADDGRHRVDVFDRSGRRTDELILPAGYRFVGAGLLGIYAAVKNSDDEDELVRLKTKP